MVIIRRIAMIELKDNELKFKFPNIHPKAGCNINFQRTLRIPDDNNEYPLPPGLGKFPLHHVDDYEKNLPNKWKKHGGVFLPMYQSEALWISFKGSYPCAVKVAAGKINAVSGQQWSNTLSKKPQDYVVSSEQQWLDGFNVSEGYIRQFIAMPLGEGFTAEEQITNKAEIGGLQIVVYPMKESFYQEFFGDVCNSVVEAVSYLILTTNELGFAPGGLMRQNIEEDGYGIDAWDQENGSRCFIHLLNSDEYKLVTGSNPPHQAPSSQDYNEAGMPWFEYYSDNKALPGSDILGKLTSVAAKSVEKGDGPLEKNHSVTPNNIKIIKKSNIVRDGEF
jgi:hypothetical protein